MSTFLQATGLNIGDGQGGTIALSIKEGIIKNLHQSLATFLQARAPQSGSVIAGGSINYRIPLYGVTQEYSVGQTVQAKVLSIDTAEKKLSLGIKEVQAYDPAPKAEELDENGNPIVKEKKERAPRKERAPKAEGEVKERKPRAPKAPKEEEFHDNITPSGTSMADLVGDLGLDFSEEN